MTLFTLPKSKNLIAFAHDTFMAAASFVLALYLRLGAEGFSTTASYLLPATLIFTGICVTVFLTMRLYKGIWRYASMQDLIAITKAVTLSLLIFLPAMFFLTRMEGYPRSALVINWLLLMGMLGAPRLAWRMYKDGGLHWTISQLTDKRVPVVLVGGGDEAELFIRNCSRKEESAYRVVGIVDDNPLHMGRNIHGVRVYGDLSTLPKVLNKLKRKSLGAQKIIIADAKLPSEKIRTLLEYAEEKGLTLARTPKLTDFRDTANMSGDPVTPIAIEDLLGRPQTTLDIKAIGKFLQGKRVMVTGAGGTIGSELVRQIASFAPSSLLLIEQSEFALYTIDKELDDKKYGAVRHPILADVRDRHYMQTICRQHKPQVIFHAAAIKHVPLAEGNPHEAVMTNTIGTRNIADAARDCKAEAMVMISTDKAVHPTSLMGATKRAAEIYAQSLGSEGSKDHPTRFMTVRFGNVLGSNGSVVPLFKKQLAKGGPITITHPEMVRYFMTVREAVELVLQAGAEPEKRQSYKSGHIYVLDMGEPVKIKDLAEHMIRLSGLQPGKDIAIETVGIRPGEKLYEELFYDDESQQPAHHPGLMLAHSKHSDYKSVQRIVTAMESAAVRRNTARMYTLLHEMVEAYRPSSFAENRPTMPTVFAHAGSHRQH